MESFRFPNYYPLYFFRLSLFPEPIRKIIAKCESLSGPKARQRLRARPPQTTKNRAIEASAKVSAPGRGTGSKVRSRSLEQESEAGARGQYRHRFRGDGSGHPHPPLCLRSLLPGGFLTFLHVVLEAKFFGFWALAPNQLCSLRSCHGQPELQAKTIQHISGGHHFSTCHHAS